RGTFYDGSPVGTPAELSALLLKRPVPLVRTLTENLMAFALGRRVEYFDQPTVRAISTAAEKNDYRMSSFILGVVKSDAFRLKRADPAPAPTGKSGSNPSLRRPRPCRSGLATTFLAAPSSRGWARLWPCPSSMRWSPQGSAPRYAPPNPLPARHASSAWRRCTVWPAARRSAKRSSSSRPRRR